MTQNPQIFTYEEYNKYINTIISDNFEIIEDESRNLFEKKIKFLLLIKHMGTHNMMGSTKYKNFDKIEIKRLHIKNFLENMQISNQNAKYINMMFPNKLVYVIKQSIDYSIKLKMIQNI